MLSWFVRVCAWRVPPHPTSVTLIARIAEVVGQLSVRLDPARDLRLRRINRIRSIRRSLAIEGNTLSEAQISAILDGKRVIAPPREIGRRATPLPPTTD